MKSDRSPAMLLGLKAAGLDKSVALGVDRNGQFHFATSLTTVEDALFMVECARTHLLNLLEEGENNAIEGISDVDDDADGAGESVGQRAQLIN